MLFAGLAVAFGGILVIDNIKENSIAQKRKRENARLLSIEKLEQYQNAREQYVKKQLELWQRTGLPPNKWK